MCAFGKQDFFIEFVYVANFVFFRDKVAAKQVKCIAEAPARFVYGKLILLVGIVVDEEMHDVTASTQHHTG